MRPETAPGPAPPLPGAIRLAFGLGLAVTLACAAFLVWRTAILEPYADMYDWIVRYERLRSDGDLWGYLWAPHNFHHLVWTMTIQALDLRVFGASSLLFLAVGVLSLAGTAGLLAWAAGKAAGPGLRLLGAGVAAALSTMGCHVLDASAPINTTYLHALVFAVAAILLAEGPGGGRPGRRVASLACAIASALGNAAGLAVWPALIFGAWRRGQRVWSLGLLVGAMVFAALYAAGQPLPVSPAGSAAIVTRLGEALSYFVNDLGLPWGRGVSQGWILGLAMLVAAGAAIVRQGRRDAPWTERAATALIVFSLASAALAAIARSGAYDPRLVPLRYSVFMIPLHVGLSIHLLPHLRRALTRRSRLAWATVAAAAVLMVANQTDMALYAMGSADQHLRAIVDFKAGRRTAQMSTTIYPDLAKAAAVNQRLRQRGLYQRELRAAPPPQS